MTPAQYLVGVQTKIQKLWLSGGTRDLEKAESPHVRFIVLPDGNIQNPSISQSSTIPAVDMRALGCVQMAAPFAPLPPGMLKDPVTIDFELNINHVTREQLAASGRTNDLVKQSRQLIAQGRTTEGVKLLENALNNAPPGQFVGANLKFELSNLYFNQAQLILIQDPHSAQALELAYKALAYAPNNKLAQDLVKQMTAMGNH